MTRQYWIGELFVSVGRSQKELRLYAVVIPLEWIQESLRILCGFCLKDGYEATRTDTSLMPFQIFHLDTEPGEEQGRVDLLVLCLHLNFKVVHWDEICKDGNVCPPGEVCSKVQNGK